MELNLLAIDGFPIVQASCPPSLLDEVAMANLTKFRVDPLLIKVLSDTYRSTEKALKELVDNAWDADATEVRITLPAPMTRDPIIVSDNGSGMIPSEVENTYMVVADDRRSRSGDLTRIHRRQVKGRKGIGKFAGLMAANTMGMETKSRGQRTHVEIPMSALKPREAGLETVEVPIHVSTDCDPDDHGTTITLSDLIQGLVYPNAEQLRKLLFHEYGRAENFSIFVDGAQLNMGDLPGLPHQHCEHLPSVGSVDLRMTIGDGKQRFKGSGIVLKVGGKTVGDPGFFGLEDDEEVPKRLLKQVYGEVHADGLLPGVTGDWGAIIENTVGYKELIDFVGQQVKAKLTEVHKRDMALAKARIQRRIEAALAKLPEHRRRIAERYLQRVLAKFYDEPDEKLTVIINLCLEAMEVDDYYVVVENLEKAEKGDVSTFAQALQDFGLLDMAFMMRQAQRRMQYLDHLEHLINDPKTTEKLLHNAIAQNLWVLGPQYALITSNRTLATVIEQYGSDKFQGARASKRPDLFLGQVMSSGHLLIEFKRPSKAIDRDDEAQAVKYRDDLRKTFEPIEILLIGKGRASSVDPRDTSRGVTVVSYAQLVSTARNQLAWLLQQQLTDHRLPPMGAAVAPIL